MSDRASGATSSEATIVDARRSRGVSIQDLTADLIKPQDTTSGQRCPGVKTAAFSEKALIYTAISEFPKWRKYLILLSFLDNSSARPVQIGGVDVNICHSRFDRSPRTPAVQFAIPSAGGHFVAHGRALWKLTGPWTHRTRPPRLGKRCAFSTSFHRAFPIKSPTKNSERPLNIVGKPG